MSGDQGRITKLFSWVVTSVAAPSSQARRLTVVVAGAYALGALLPFWVLDDPSSGAAFFPAAGVTLAALAMTNRRIWAPLVVAVGVTEFVIDRAHDQSVAMAFGFALANMAEPVLGATLLQRWVSPRRPPRLQLAGFVAGAVLLGPCLGAAIGATTASLAGDAEWPTTFVHWWMGDGLGVLIVATPIVAARYFRVRPSNWVPRQATFSIVLGLLGVVIALVSATSLVEAPVAYLLLPILMLVALRGGVQGVGLVALPIAFITSWGAATGNGYLATLTHGQSAVVMIQFLLGVTVLSAHVLAVETSERMAMESALRRSRLAEADARLASIAATAAVRETIAREVHDLVGSTVNVLVLQAGAARVTLDTDPERTRRLLVSMEQVGRETLRELDQVLRDDAPESNDPQEHVSLDRVAELVDAMVEAGCEIDLRYEGEARPLGLLVDRSAFRIVQESLTNMVKHSGQHRASVLIEYESDSILLRVEDDGSGPSDTVVPGRGLIGIRERVAALGGDLRIELPECGGFAVEARLPTVLERARP